MSEVQVISFNEIIPEATVRVIVIDDIQYLSIIDIISVMCGQTTHNAAQTWRRLPENYKNELETSCSQYKFKGRGQREQPVIQFQGALKLMMWLPGEQAKKFRSKAAEILTRYYAGDKTLLNDVWANAQSKQPINEAAREALDCVEEEDREAKRQKMELCETGEWAREASTMIQSANTHLRKHIGLKRQLYNVEVDGERKKLEVKEAQYSRQVQHEEDMLRVAEMIHDQKMKHGDADIELMKRTELAKIEVTQHLKVVRGCATFELEQNTHTTVVSVFENSRGQFKGLLKKSEHELLGRAGFRAKCDYKAIAGLEPLHNMDGVYVYPISAAGLILEALRTVYRSMLAGDTQATIEDFLVIGKPTHGELVGM